MPSSLKSLSRLKDLQAPGSHFNLTLLDVASDVNQRLASSMSTDYESHFVHGKEENAHSRKTMYGIQLSFHHTF